MIKKLLWGLFAFSFVLSGCATLINQTKRQDFKGFHCAVVPFTNYSETPLAGSRVAAILYGVLKSKGYNVDLVNGAEKGDLIKEGYRCVISGYVNEWRYKVGIDGEPAVSVTYVVKDLKTGKKLASGSLSATEWGNKSLGLMTQELFDKAF
ncbi:hypothetical protein SAMN06265339_0616 [Desulfurobacterium pacificum]|uniref:Lipoprotein n=1 Tax=Desulfurobacterium pacificum TaxID=240166 RepID=A0ABY1NGE6_9BACT|nr:hypothetical protein [Desulfurobacterium pacificum]SMP08373.1 hypothetical protein SAMN06265339_0616 [Desulfurobacterium pacificum]